MPEQTFTGSLKPGAKLGKYEVGEQIATGGMAVIYKAYDPTLDRPVAIKQIAPHLAQDERFLERFRTEAQTLAKLSGSQANIVNVHELIQHDGQLFLVMEYVEGTTLRVLMDRGPVPLQTGLGVLLSTALGLRAMHKNNIVHRDLTPANVMMAKDGALKITDFGLIGHSGGKTSLPMGTTKYMAPEMFTGAPVDGRADVYSLGLIAYEMFAGPEKFQEVFRDVLRDDRAQQVRWMHWHSNPALAAPALKELQPGIPPLVSKIVERMMEKDPSKRFASSDQIIKWLRRIFVMHVQGKSVTQTDSESLEKEMEADTAMGGVAPGVRQAGAAGGAMVRAGAAGAVAGEGSGEKTAPIPVPKWTWKRAGFWAAVIAGPLLAAAIGLLIWHQHTVGVRRTEAQRIWNDADEKYETGEFEAAMDAFKRIAMEFEDLPSIASEASQRTWMARAEWKLGAKEWDAAANAATTADKKHYAPATWVDGFWQRFNKSKEVEQVMKDVDMASEQGNFEQCINLLASLQSRYPEIDLNEDIARYREQKDLREYTAYIDKAKDYITKGMWNDALVVLVNAEKIRSGSETKDLRQKVEVEKNYTTLVQQLQRAEADKNWVDVANFAKAVMDLKPSDALKARYNHAMAESLAEVARTLEKNDVWDAAYEKWAEVLKYNPTHPEALARGKQRSLQNTIDTYVKSGKDAMRKGEWDQAINSYELVLKTIDPRKDADIKATAEKAIEDAKYNKALEGAKSALARKEFDEAERLAKEAGAIKDSAEVKSLIQRTDTQRQYTRHLEVAKTLLGQSNWVKALGALQDAQKIMDTQEVRDLIAETNYRRYYAQAKSFMQDGRLKEALSMAKIAQKYKDTVEIQGLIDLLNRAVEAANQAPKG
ncbi:MAG: serine/threonine protein kinase [Planctomycetes bacterium]|nr:serine/threonine protein kinase [Planctomycetota bacterium]